MRSNASDLRWQFAHGLWYGLGVVWPIISGILVLQFAMGTLVAYLEGWSLSAGWYFTSVTGLTIGYGDLVPQSPLARLLAVVIGVFGILLTALVAAVAVRALQVALDAGR